MMMPSPKCHTYLKTCKLYVAIFVASLIFLPSLFASLIFLSFFSFFLFLPIVCVVAATLALPVIISRLPMIGSVGRALLTSDHDGKTIACIRDCVEFDTSEVPSIEESTTSDEEESTVEGRAENLVNLQALPSFEDLVNLQSTAEIIQSGEPKGVSHVLAPLTL